MKKLAVQVLIDPLPSNVQYAEEENESEENAVVPQNEKNQPASPPSSPDESAHCIFLKRNTH